MQFRRACQILGIELITTSTAQAKGRVERFMRTAQDRLSNELKANGISSIAQANDYLKQVFIPSHNQRYGAPPGSSQSVFSELEPQLKTESGLHPSITPYQDYSKRQCHKLPRQAVLTYGG